MLAEEIIVQAQRLITDAQSVPTPGMTNYKTVFDKYKLILNDALVLIRELAELENKRGSLVIVEQEKKK